MHKINVRPIINESDLQVVLTFDISNGDYETIDESLGKLSIYKLDNQNLPSNTYCGSIKTRIRSDKYDGSAYRVFFDDIKEQIKSCLPKDTKFYLFACRREFAFASSSDD